MHLKEININDDYYFNILKNIKKHVPQFESIWDEDEIYPIAFEFGNFLIKNIDNDELVKQCTKFINEAVKTGSSFTKELIMTEVFQLLYEDNEKSIKKIEANLDEEVMSLYREYRKYWIPQHAQKKGRNKR